MVVEGFGRCAPAECLAWPIVECRGALPNNFAGVHVDHERGVHEPGPGCHIREVRYPQLVGSRSTELAVHQIRCS